MIIKEQNIVPSKGVGVAIAVIAALLWSQFSGDLIRLLAPDGVFGLPYGRSILASLSDIIAMAGLICLVGRVDPATVLRLSGLTSSAMRPLMVFAPIFIGAGTLCLFVTNFASELSAWNIGWRGFGGPVSEEIVYRGLAMGALMRLAQWRFLPAALAPAVLFGLAHAAQGDSVSSSAGIVAITAIGGLLFGWLFVRWRYNLWAPIFAHMGMNSLWEVFVLGDSAIGDWFGNVLRLVVLASIIASTLLFASPRDERALY